MECQAARSGGEKAGRGRRDHAHSAVLAQGPAGSGHGMGNLPQCCEVTAGEDGEGPGVNRGQLRRHGQNSASPASPGRWEPPEISAPVQHSTLGQLSSVGILSVLVC